MWEHLINTLKEQKVFIDTDSELIKKKTKKKNFKKNGKFQMWEHLINTLKGQKVFIDTDSELIIKKTKKKFPWVYAYLRNKKFIPSIHVFNFQSCPSCFNIMNMDLNVSFKIKNVAKINAFLLPFNVPPTCI